MTIEEIIKEAFNYGYNSYHECNTYQDYERHLKDCIESFKDTEDNNSWIKIESEEDLPKGNIYCHFIIRGFEELEFKGLFDGYFWNEGQLYTWEIVTHYQEIFIEKPKPLIY
ncbi:hypothetical protein ACTS9E_04235 [Empedobacter brevis]